MTDLIKEYLKSQDMRLYGNNASIMPGENGNVISPNTFSGDIFGQNVEMTNQTPEQMQQNITGSQQNTDFGNVFVGGARDAIQGAGETISELGNFVGLKIPPPRLPEVDKPEGTINNIARGFVQFGVGMLASPVKGFSLGKNIIRGAFSDSYFDPEEGGFVTFLREMGVGPEILEVLDTRVGEDASAFERLQGRLGNAVEGAVLGGIVDTLRYIKQTPHLLQKARETIIQAGKNAEARMAEGGATLMSGVDPDPLIAGAGKMLDNTRQQDELGFYSKALDEINKITLNQGSSQQWMKTLENAGVKKDEMYWTGLDEFFKRKSNQVITKGELIDYINENQVQLKEVRLGVDGDTGEGGSLNFESDAGSYDYNIYRDEEIYHEEQYIRDDLFSYVHRTSDDSFDGPVFEDMKTEIFKEFQKEDLLAVGIDRDFTSPEEISKMVINPTDPLQPQFSGMGLPREYTFDDVIDKILREKFNADSDFDKLDEWFLNNKKIIEEEQDIPVVILDKINPRIFTNSGYKQDEIIEAIATDQINNYGEFVMESADAGDATYRIIGGGRGEDFTIQRNGEVLDTTYDLNEARVIAQQDALEQGHINYPEDIEPGSETVGQFDGPAQFASESWRESGGSNYREILLTSPNIRDATKTNFEILQGDAKTGQHHVGYKNIIAHIRITDRTTPDGRKVLYIDEIQSDWSQKGKRTGFRLTQEEYMDAKKQRANKRIEIVKLVNANLDNPLKIDLFIKDIIKDGENPDYQILGNRFDQFVNRQDELPLKVNEKVQQLLAELEPIEKKINTGGSDRLRGVGFDEGPFVKDTNKWVQMAMKRVMRMAIDEGYDAIAWTSGKVQQDRFGTSTQAKNLEIVETKRTNDENEKVFMISKVVDGYNGEILLKDRLVSFNELKDYFPSDYDKIVQRFRDEDFKNKTIKFEDGSMAFNRQGLKEQYDKIVPNNSSKIVRRLDKSAKLETIEVENLGDRLAIVITDKMRQSVKGGQSLFTGPAVVGAGATGAVMANQGAEDGNTN
jgi:hypothetical protein